MTMPLITRLGSHLPAAEGSDVWIHEWTFWWIERALLNLQSPFYTDLLFHPTGTSLTTHNIAWFNIGLWFPLQAAVGNTVAYSLTYILVFTLNAFNMYLLTFAWTRSRSAAVIAGIIYGFWPYTFTQSGHPNMATIMWPPLALIYLRRINASGNQPDQRSIKRDIALAGIFIALTGIARWQLLIVSSILFGIYLLYLFVKSTSYLRRDAAVDLQRTALLKSIWRIVAPFLLAVLLMAPLAGPVIYTQLTQDFPEEVLVYEPWFGTPLLTYILPNSRLGIYGSLVEELPEWLQFHYQRVDFLGYTVLLLALFGLIGRWWKTWIWLLVALVYWTLALGPELALAYERLPELPMPYRLVADFPLVQIVRRPHRFNAFAGLPLGLMAAYGVTVILGRIATPRGSHSTVEALHRASPRGASSRLGLVVTVVLAALILAEYRPTPYGLESTYIPKWYYKLAQEPEEFAIFGLPPSPRLADKYFMHYQILHQKPMVEGHISRPTYATFGFMDQSDYLWHLRIHRTMKSELVDVTNQLQILVDANVRYLILHKYLLTDEQLTQFMDWLTYEPFYEDNEVLVYNADPVVGQDFEVTDWLNDEIGLISLAVGPEEVQQAETISLDARWASRAAPKKDYSGCILLINPDDQVTDQQCYAIGGSWPTSAWGASEVARGDYGMQINPLMDPDRYTIEFGLIESASSTLTGDELRAAAASLRSIGAITVKERGRLFAPPPQPYQSTLTWGEQIQLVGFDVDHSEGQLRLTLVWQALERMAQSYKVFVHVIDEVTGERVAQNDSIPRQWSYPTTWWEASEYVDETIELQLDTSASGKFRVFIGLYDEKTGVRLPVIDADGRQFVDDAALLDFFD